MNVHIFDTDCYGPMWHGAYIKWLEIGRVDWLREHGIVLEKPGEGTIYPVVEQHLRFRSPARLHDRLEISTELALDRYRLVFKQTIAQKQSQKLVLEAETVCVVLDSQWKPQRRLPEALLAILQPALAEETLAASPAC
ncbi:MAG: thioesterase family protein [Candidatus Melainabacteria bacterium]|nr:thioesterase family protein [Candidatus Melainabacteria bacterium]